MKQVFVSWKMALLSAQALAFYYASNGYLVSCTFCENIDECLVVVHRKFDENIRIPKGYIFSEREDHDYPVGIDVEEPFAVTYFRYYTDER